MNPNENQNDVRSYQRVEYDGLLQLLQSGQNLTDDQRNRLVSLATNLDLPNPLKQPSAVTIPQPIDESANQHPSSLKGFLSLLRFGVSVIIIAAFINAFVFRPYQVDGTSMTPTLQNNDRLIVVKVARTWARITRHDFIPSRGTIIVLDTTLGNDKQLVKRVIGLPGERVVVKDGRITIYNKDNPNGFDPDDAAWGKDLAPTSGNVDVVVPPDELFICGDNRVPGGSNDSRSQVGTIPADHVIGVAKFRVLPINKARIL